jgi:hypothetical protein
MEFILFELLNNSFASSNEKNNISVVIQDKTSEKLESVTGDD